MNAVYGGWQELLNSKSSLPGRCPWPLRSVARLVRVFVVVFVKSLLPVGGVSLWVAVHRIRSTFEKK